MSVERLSGVASDENDDPLGLPQNLDPDKKAQVVFDGVTETVVYVKTKFPCGLCPHVAPSHGALTQHKNHHHTDKQCQHCKQVFSWDEEAKMSCSRQLSDHKLKCPSPQCKLCGKTFSARGAMLKHVAKKVCSSQGLGDARCGVCLQEFHGRRALEVHVCPKRAEWNDRLKKWVISPNPRVLVDKRIEKVLGKDKK